MVEATNLDWIESVQLVFDYFSERTPRSYVETRETSLVWSYKYADPDFGRQQARDLLQLCGQVQFPMQPSMSFKELNR